MAIKFDGRSGSLANGANTTDSGNAYPLPGANGGTLIDFSISIGGNSGPALFALLIFRGGSSVDVSQIESEFWLRSSALGALPDIYTLPREVHYPGNSTLRVYVRNDTGSAIVWSARWAAEIA